MRNQDEICWALRNAAIRTIDHANSQYVFGEKGEIAPKYTPAEVLERLGVTELVCWHGTSATNAARIKLEGLCPGKGKGADTWAKVRMGDDFASSDFRYLKGNREKAVYITPDAGEALKFAGFASEINEDAPAIVRVRLTAAEFGRLAFDEQDANALRFHGMIPPSQIRIVEAG